MFWVPLYELVDDYLERRAPLQAAHLALAQAAHDRGELVLGGALADPPDQAIPVFRTDDRSQVETFVTADPYVEHGLITAWRIRPWNVEIGPG